MSTLQQPTKRADAVDRSETEARPIPERGAWANFFYGMGTVLELFPSGEIAEPPDDVSQAKDAQEAIDESFQRVNLSMWVAFEKLAAEFEEVQLMPSAPKFSLPPPELLERYKQIA